MNLPDRILVIRRDNIGDLVCTAPLPYLEAGSLAMRLAAYVNSYNALVLADHPNVNVIDAYEKLLLHSTKLSS